MKLMDILAVIIKLKTLGGDSMIAQKKKIQADTQKSSL